jgi:hypothetical protein
MPIYFSAHTTACLTKQVLKQLMKDLSKATEIKVRRSVASQIGGRMLVEAETSGQATLEKFFPSRYINCEWVMRIDLYAHNGEVTEY